MGKLDERFRFVTKEKITELQVKSLTWQSPYQGRFRWKVVLKLSNRKLLSEAEKIRLTRVISYDTRYFETCRICGLHDLVGFFIDIDLCHGCAQKEGVVF